MSFLVLTIVNVFTYYVLISVKHLIVSCFYHCNMLIKGKPALNYLNCSSLVL